jgi:hypothetical protein
VDERERKINREKRKVEWEEEGSERGSGQEEMC